MKKSNQWKRFGGHTFLLKIYMTKSRAPLSRYNIPGPTISLCCLQLQKPGSTPSQDQLLHKDRNSNPTVLQNVILDPSSQWNWSFMKVYRCLFVCIRCLWKIYQELIFGIFVSLFSIRSTLLKFLRDPNIQSIWLSDKMRKFRWRINWFVNILNKLWSLNWPLH